MLDWAPIWWTTLLRKSQFLKEIVKGVHTQVEFT